MAEINNSLAAQIQVPQIDLASTLGKAAQINSLNASTERTQQEVEHNKFLYKQGGGYTPGELQTQAVTQQQHLENGGRIGNAYLANPTDASWSAAVDEASKVGLIRGGSLEKAQYLSLPPQQRMSVAKSLQQAGMPSQTAVEQTGVPAGNTTREAGKYIPEGIQPNTPIISRTEAATGGRQPVTQQRVDNAISSGRNFDGSPRVTSAADVVGTPQVVRNPDGSISSSVTPETTGTQQSLAQDYAGYRENGKNAAMTKYLLRNMQDDADRLSTGKGATFTNTAKQWIQSAQTLPGVGESIKKITGDISDPIAAFEAIQKNAGQLTRATMKDVDGKAASEYSMIQKQLPNAEMSPRGLKLVAAQMMAPEDFKQAKLQAADNWKKGNNGSLGGFESDWNKNITPTTFLFARLPAQDRDVLIQNLGKTSQGKETLARIKQQSIWAHNNGLDGVLD